MKVLTVLVATVNKVGRALVHRLRLTRLDGLSLPMRALTLGCAVAVFGCVAIAFWWSGESWTPAVVSSRLAVLVVMISAIFLSMATVTMVMLMEPGDRGRREWWQLIGVSVAAFLPARALLADGHGGWAAAAAACAFAATVVPPALARRTKPTQTQALAVSTLFAPPWIVGLAPAFPDPTGSSLWILLLVSSYPVFIIVLTFAIARTIEERFSHTRIRSRGRKVGVCCTDR